MIHFWHLINNSTGVELSSSSSNCPSSMNTSSNSSISGNNSSWVGNSSGSSNSSNSENSIGSRCNEDGHGSSNSTVGKVVVMM